MKADILKTGEAAILQLNAFGASSTAHCPPNNVATKSNIENCIYKISKVKYYTEHKKISWKNPKSLKENIYSLKSGEKKTIK